MLLCYDIHEILHEEETFMKYCTKCGAVCEDSAAFCKDCGNPFPQAGQGNTSGYQDPNAGQNYGQNYNYSYGPQGGQSYAQPGHPGIIPRSIPLCILFTFITCGIYGIYWMIKMNDEINLLAGEPNATSGVMVFLFSIITCGIYGFYWLAQINNCVNELADPPKKTSGLVVVLLTIVTVGIYGFLWAYRMGGLLDAALAKRSMPTQNRSVTYLILAVLQLGFVGWILMQNTINSMIPDEA